MKILVLNSGSSSIKYKIFQLDTLDEVYEGEKEEIKDHLSAVKETVNELIEKKVIKTFDDIKVVGHRVVHGGDFFKEPTLINEDVMQKIDQLSALAPLHNPSNLAGIKAVKEHSASTPQVAVFDTAFHQSIPDYANRYGLPYNYYEDLSIKRYGFHGTSHHYVAKKTAKLLGKDLSKLNLITAHLGNGASVCAIKEGRSIDTSMGFTPLEGLVMGTRCGDIDASLVLYIKEKLNLTDIQVEDILNKQSGLKGICGVSDVREIEKLYAKGDKRAMLAFDMFIYKIIKYIGSYMMVLGSVDAVVLTGGIGEHSLLTKEHISKSLKMYNLKVMTVSTNEELEIASMSKKLINA